MACDVFLDCVYCVYLVGVLVVCVVCLVYGVCGFYGGLVLCVCVRVWYLCVRGVFLCGVCWGDRES